MDANTPALTLDGLAPVAVSILPSSGDGREVETDLVPLAVEIRQGRSTMPLAALLGLQTGTVLDLNRLSAQPVEVWVNGVLHAHGQLVARNGHWEVEITALLRN